MAMLVTRTALLFFLAIPGSFGAVAATKTVSAGAATVSLPDGWYSNISVSRDLSASVKSSVTLSPDRDIQHSLHYFGIHERRKYKPNAVDELEGYAKRNGNVASTILVDGEKLVVREYVEKSDASRPLAQWVGKVNHLGVTYWITAGAPDKEREKFASTIRSILSSWKWKSEK